MKIFSKRKRIVIVFLLAILLLRIVYIMYGQIDKEYYTSEKISLDHALEVPCKNIFLNFSSNEKRLNSIEFIVSGLPDDRAGIIEIKILEKDELLFQTKVSFSNMENYEWKKIFVNLAIDGGAIYQITFNSLECTQVPCILLVEKDMSKESMETYAENKKLDKQMALKYGYLREPTFIDKCINSLMWCLLFLIISAFLLYSEAIYKNVRLVKHKLCQIENIEAVVIIVEIILCMIILESSGVEFHQSTKIVFYVISLLGTWKIREKRAWLNSLINKPWKIGGWYFLCFFAAFSLVGQRVLIYPLDQKITIAGLFVYMIAVIWFIPIIISIIFLFEILSSKLFVKEKKWTSIKFIFFCTIFLLLPALFNLYANNPGISSMDTITCMVRNAHNLRGMFNWHPAFYCMVLKVLLRIWDSTYMVIFIQYFFWLYVILEGLLYLRKKGVDERALLLAAFLLGISPGNFIHLNTIWKDIPYTLSILWTLILLSKLVFDDKIYKKKRYIF